MLPDKSIKLSYSVLGIGASLLKTMNDEETVSSLWEKVKKHESINTYEKFIKGLLVLYSVGVVDLEKDILQKVRHEN